MPVVSMKRKAASVKASPKKKAVAMQASAKKTSSKKSAVPKKAVVKKDEKNKKAVKSNEKGNPEGDENPTERGNANEQANFNGQAVDSFADLEAVLSEATAIYRKVQAEEKILDTQVRKTKSEIKDLETKFKKIKEEHDIKKTQLTKAKQRYDDAMEAVEAYEDEHSTEQEPMVPLGEFEPLRFKCDLRAEQNEDQYVEVKLNVSIEMDVFLIDKRKVTRAEGIKHKSKPIPYKTWADAVQKSGSPIPGTEKQAKAALHSALNFGDTACLGETFLASFYYDELIEDDIQGEFDGELKREYSDLEGLVDLKKKLLNSLNLQQRVSNFIKRQEQRRCTSVTATYEGDKKKRKMNCSGTSSRKLLITGMRDGLGEALAMQVTFNFRGRSCGGSDDDYDW